MTWRLRLFSDLRCTGPYRSGPWFHVYRTRTGRSCGRGALNKLMAGNISSSLKAKLSKLADLIEKVDQIKNEEYNSLGTNAYSTISAPLNEEMTPELNKVYKKVGLVPRKRG